MRRNYESRYWACIYDQTVAESPDVLDDTLAFYRSNLRVSDRVLDCACGTGALLLPLVAEGQDVHGFDVSEAMLGAPRLGGGALAGGTCHNAHTRTLGQNAA